MECETHSPEGGKLTAVLASYDEKPEVTDELMLRGNRPCDRAMLQKTVDYFIPDTAKTPFPLKKGEELWVEVTVPPMGPAAADPVSASQRMAPSTPLALH